MTAVRNVIIIGSSPAGYAAAVYTARATGTCLPSPVHPNRHRGTLACGDVVDNTYRQAVTAGAALAGAPAGLLRLPRPAGQRQVHHLSSGTPARTCWAWAPQQAQVIFLQRSQTAGLHMRVSVLLPYRMAPGPVLVRP
jgi:hypothetical protein